jgi:pimeloyl-ACP methyl ester carboxylesterase
MNTLDVTHASVRLPSGDVMLDGDLALPASATGIVVFAHGSGSSRHSPRNRYVAGVMNSANLGTLLFDLLTPAEERVDIHTREFRFDIGLLARRLVDAVAWLRKWNETAGLNVGLFGSSTGGAAALVAAAKLGERISAVVSRGGRPDLAGDDLPLVKSPVLLIVGGWDDVVIELNRQAYERLTCEKELRIIPHATHLFEEPGKLEAVAELAAGFFSTHLNLKAKRAAL